MVMQLDERKLFAGARVRRIRLEQGLTQTEMAARLGLSNSYLNLIERNQRPLTASVLLRLASTFDLELRTLIEPEKRVTEEGLAEIFADPALAGVSVSRAEIQDLIAAAPNAAAAIEALYALHRGHLRSAESAPPPSRQREARRLRWSACVTSFPSDTTTSRRSRPSLSG